MRPLQQCRFSSRQLLLEVAENQLYQDADLVHNGEVMNKVLRNLPPAKPAPTL